MDAKVPLEAATRRPLVQIREKRPLHPGAGNNACFYDHRVKPTAN